MGVEPTVRTFWNASLDSLAELLSDWLTRADSERQACDGPELAKKAVAHIRASWPAWPRLGDDDATRLTRYVVSEEVLQSARNAAVLQVLCLLMPTAPTLTSSHMQHPWRTE